MKTDVWAFVAENKTSSKADCVYENRDQVGVLRSSFPGICSEVFVWSVKNHLALWAAGTDVIQLLNLFFKNVNHVDKIQLIQGKKALDYLWSVANGFSWHDCGTFEKLSSFKEAYLYAHIRGQLGPVLSPVVDDSFKALVRNPWVAATRQSWQVAHKTTKHFLEINGVEPETRDELLRHNPN